MRKIFFTLTLIALVIGLSGCTAEPAKVEKEFTDSEKVELAQCLTDSGAKMYGAIWCSHCNNQKKAFGSAFAYVDYVECDAGTDLEGAKACIAADIKGYPTWVFGDGSRQSGEIPLPELAELAGC